MAWFRQSGFDGTPAEHLLGDVAAAANTFTVHHGKQYQATVTLNWFEQQIATNQTIAGQFSSLGFTSVTVAGAGSTRLAKGLWMGKDTTAPIDSHLSHIIELG
jgi:hypothetical protein